MTPTYLTKPDGIWLDYGENKLIGPYQSREAAEKDAEGLKLTIPINVVTLWAWQERVERAIKAVKQGREREGLKELDRLFIQITEARRNGKA